jgi:hypothetical protein
MHTEFARGNVMERDQLELLSVDAVLKRILKNRMGQRGMESHGAGQRVAVNTILDVSVPYKVGNLLNVWFPKDSAPWS